eukprot:7961912-Pyramimonas_sp.AAC.1
MRGTPAEGRRYRFPCLSKVAYSPPYACVSCASERIILAPTVAFSDERREICDQQLHSRKVT